MAVLDGMATAAPSQQLIFGCRISAAILDRMVHLHPIQIDFWCRIPTTILDGMVTAASNKN